MATSNKAPARHPINHAAPALLDPVAQARAELLAASDAVKHASRALVLVQRRHEDARVGLARAIEDRSTVESI